MGDVVGGLFGGLFGDEPDYVGDSIEAQKRSLAEAMEKGRILADSQYTRNLRAAYDTAALNRYNQITPYGSLTWYNTNDPQEADRLADEDRFNSFVNELMGDQSMGSENNKNLDTMIWAADKFLGSDPEAARVAMNMMNNGTLAQIARDQYQPPDEGEMSALDAYNHNFQQQKAAHQQAVRDFQQPNGDVGIGTVRQFKDPTLEQEQK